MRWFDSHLGPATPLSRTFSRRPDLFRARRDRLLTGGPPRDVVSGSTIRRTLGRGGPGMLHPLDGGERRPEKGHAGGHDQPINPPCAPVTVGWDRPWALRPNRNALGSSPPRPRVGGGFPTYDLRPRRPTRDLRRTRLITPTPRGVPRVHDLARRARSSRWPPVSSPSGKPTCSLSGSTGCRPVPASGQRRLPRSWPRSSRSGRRRWSWRVTRRSSGWTTRAGSSCPV